METKVIKIDSAAPDVAKIEQAAKLVDAGGLVAFPTETVYGIASRVEASSLARLDEIKERNSQKRYTLHIGEKNDVEKYVPAVPLRARQLIKKLWPGPLTIVFKLDERSIDKQRINLGKEIFEGLYKDNSIGVRCPDNTVALTLLQSIENAVVAPSANLAGQAPAVEAEEVLTQLDGRIDLLLDGGPCKYKKSSTVVEIGQKKLEILRQGVYEQEYIEEMSKVSFLFVCTGNTCRSPMAEGMFRKYLAEKLGCEIDCLDRMGYKVSSAGAIGVPGFGASREAIAVCEKKSIDIKGHRSKTLCSDLIEQSDYIFAMCKRHCEEIAALSPEAKDRCTLLAENTEIPDPIGETATIYNKCAELIEDSVKKRVGQFFGS